jgi:hypothetical protein
MMEGVPLGRKVQAEILSSIPETIGSLFLEMNMPVPVLVRTSLNCASPERLSATADLSRSDFA